MKATAQIKEHRTHGMGEGRWVKWVKEMEKRKKERKGGREGGGNEIISDKIDVYEENETR